MMAWAPQFDTDAPRILCLGAHCDDIEIGCGGMLLQLARRYPEAIVHCVVFSSNPAREKETRAALGSLLKKVAVTEIEVLNFRNSYFPYIGAEIKDAFGGIRKAGSPDLVLTHFREDRHQDHRTISDLSWNTFRDHTILEYEIPKYDGDLTQVNTYVPLVDEVVDEKVSTLMNCFPSQAGRQWFSEDTFRSLLRLRGIECNAASGYAEGFVSRKTTITL